jgi:hypothetical protein
LCGLEIPSHVKLDGTSLVGALRGDASALRDRTLFVHSQRIPYPEMWRKCAVMTERWRLVNGEELYHIQADPAQKQDLAKERPELVKRFREAYGQWWESLKPVFDDYVYIGIGSDAEPRTLLHSHDWHATEQGACPWNQGQVRSGMPGNGFWAVDVTRAGAYQFTLRRWPEQLDQPIEAARARLKIGDVDVPQSLKASATHATFGVQLKAGKTRLQTWLTAPRGRTRGAYFVYIERLD